MKVPWRVFRSVKTYANATVCSLTYARPNDHVNPSRISRTTAPFSHDLKPIILEFLPGVVIIIIFLYPR